MIYIRIALMLFLLTSSSFAGDGRWGSGGTTGIVVRSDCSTITEGCCIDSDDKTFYCVDGVFSNTLTVGDSMSAIDVDYPLIEKLDSNGDIAYSETVRYHVLTDGEQLTEFSEWGQSEGVLIRKKVAGSISLGDGSEFDFYDAYQGFGKISIGDTSEYAYISFTSAGAVTLDTQSTNVTTTDGTDGNLNIYDGGTNITIENQLGATLTLDYSFEVGKP